MTSKKVVPEFSSNIVRVVNDTGFWFCVKDLHKLFHDKLGLSLDSPGVINSIKYFRSLDADGFVVNEMYISQGALYISLLCSFQDAEEIFANILLTACCFFHDNHLGIPVCMDRFKIAPLHSETIEKESEAQNG
jgi:hypothetical protein